MTAPDPARRPPDELRERCVLAVAEALAGYYSDKDPEGEATAHLAVDAVLPLVADATAEQIAAAMRARCSHGDDHWGAYTDPEKCQYPLCAFARDLLSGDWKQP